MRYWNGFTKVIGLEIILYSISIRDFINQCPIHFDSWSYVIYIGLGLSRHPRSFNQVRDRYRFLSSYSTTSNHNVTGSIIVTDFICKFSFLNFLRMMQGPIISTQSLFRSIYSDILAGNLPYFLFDRFVHCQVVQLLTSLRTESMMLGQYKC